MLAKRALPTKLIRAALLQPQNNDVPHARGASAQIPPASPLEPPESPRGIAAPANGEPALRVLPEASLRPRVRGKFLFVGDEKFYIRGVTYGTFRPDAEGHEFPAPDVVEQDFSLMAANGVNSVRAYTPPPTWLLDAAQRHGLRVMVGLPVERSAGFMDYSNCVRSIQAMVREQVRQCAGHPAVLCYTIGNEIPASVVRWQGRTRVERFLERLYQVVKEEDPEGLVTYVNYPSTEYLCLPFLDFVCFNVYLESQERFEAYLARLHNIACERPLVMGELGLDSLRHGDAAQARALDWQVRTGFAAGCAGVFVYSWTDQWYRGGADVYDWKFGVTDMQRRPKAALATVRAAFAEVPFRADMQWPRVSVIVCSYNGSRTIGDTCQALGRLDYPDFEVIVVDDGSSDSTAIIAREFGFKVISTSKLGLSSALPGRQNGHDWLITKSNRGLSNARNLGLDAATGDIVAYLDDDAYPDPQWLRYLAAFFLNPQTEKYAGVGGPNIAPPGDGLIADCVAHAPGGPVHVLLTNRKAEHIPGCNMAFRREALEAINGFDPQFRKAGDDVDVCWRLQQEGWSLGFSPAAMVWHHRRNSVLTYWKQQKGYGKAEAMLERKWPEKYNLAGQATWSGRIYTNGLTYFGWRARRVRYGLWGSACFQSLDEPPLNRFESMPMMPEWYLIIIALAGLSLLGWAWKPLELAWPALGLCAAISLTQAFRAALGAAFKPPPPRRMARWKSRGLIAALFLMQPLARLLGRLRHGLHFWRRRAVMGYAWPRSWKADLWTTENLPVEQRLEAIEAALRKQGWLPVRGSDFDQWDIEVRGGLLGSARLHTAVEPHGSGRQLLRIQCMPRFSSAGIGLAALFSLLGYAAAKDGAWTVYPLLSGVGLLILARSLLECAAATAAFLTVVRKIKRIEQPKVTDVEHFQQPNVNGSNHAPVQA